MSETRQYNYCLDFIKGIACIFVVFMHCEFPGTLGIAIQTISRYCVPLFFMVSGYYYCSQSTYAIEKRKKKAKHILNITIGASLFYILFALFQHFIWHDVDLSMSLYDFFCFIIFNKMSIIVSQMWFLYALLYVYIVFIFINPDWFRKYCLHISIVCLCLYVCLAQGLHIINIKVPNFIYKNWIIEGIGFFSLGFSLHKYESKIEVNNTTLLWILFITTILNLLERFFLGRDFGVNICSIPQATALILYAMNNPLSHKGAIQWLGLTCSLFVYIIHPFVWHSMERVYTASHIDNNILALYLMPIIVVLLSIVLSYICYKFQFRLSSSKYKL